MSGLLSDLDWRGKIFYTETCPCAKCSSTEQRGARHMFTFGDYMWACVSPEESTTVWKDWHDKESQQQVWSLERSQCDLFERDHLLSAMLGWRTWDLLENSHSPVDFFPRPSQACDRPAIIFVQSAVHHPVIWKVFHLAEWFTITFEKTSQKRSSNSSKRWNKRHIIRS